jgi:hypothetical protein
LGGTALGLQNGNFKRYRAILSQSALQCCLKLLCLGDPASTKKANMHRHCISYSRPDIQKTRAEAFLLQHAPLSFRYRTTLLLLKQ